MLFVKSKMNRCPRALLIALLLALPISASAMPITGAIGFGGLFEPTGGAGLDLSDATGLTFGFTQVTAATGDYVPALGLNPTFSPVVFSPSNTPITPLWTVNAGAITYTFDLLTLSLDFQDADQLNLSGRGVVSATGFDDTPGQWTFSGQQGNVFYTFSSITASSSEPVPTPGTLVLLAAGLAATGLFRRSKNGGAQRTAR